LMSADIPIQLRTISNDISRFVIDSKSHQNVSVKKHDDLETQQHRRLQELATTKETLKATSKNVGQELLKVRAQHAELRGLIDTLRTQETDLNSQYSNQVHLQQLVEKEVHTLKEELDNSNADKEQKKSSLAAAISTYPDRLGLRIEPCSGRGIRITLVNIDTGNHSREFKFVLHEKDSSYTVDDCHPPIDVTAALDKLNRTKDVIKFMLEMRCLFKQTV